MTEIPPEKKDQNTPEVHTITKIPPKPKRLPKYPRNLKITKIPFKYKKKCLKYPQNFKND